MSAALLREAVATIRTEWAGLVSQHLFDPLTARTHLAVADWLESVVERHTEEVAEDQEIEVEGGRATVREDVHYCGACGYVDPPCPDIDHAVAVARAYLGRADA